MRTAVRAGLAGLAVAAAVSVGSAAPASGQALASEPLGTASATTALAALASPHGGSAADRIYTYGPTPGHSKGWRVRVRSHPVDGRIRDHLYKGERITVLCAQLGESRDGYSWVRLRTRHGVVGWTRIDLVTWRASARQC